jgi:hypothetical protein
MVELPVQCHHALPYKVIKRFTPTILPSLSLTAPCGPVSGATKLRPLKELLPMIALMAMRRGKLTIAITLLENLWTSSGRATRKS